MWNVHISFFLSWCACAQNVGFIPIFILCRWLRCEKNKTHKLFQRKNREKKDEKLRFGFSCSFFLCTYPYVSGFGFFFFNFFSFAQKSVKGHVKTSLSKIYQINSKYFDHKFITPVCVRLYSLLFNFITSHTLSRTQKEWHKII